MKKKLCAGDFIAFVHFNTRKEAREWARKHPQGWKPRLYTCKIVYGPICKDIRTDGSTPVNPWYVQVFKLASESNN